MNTENQSNQQPTNISNNLVLAILTTIFCCLPFGIVSIVYAAQVNSAISAGDLPRAQDLSKKAKLWGLIALGSGIVFSILYLLFVMLIAIIESA